MGAIHGAGQITTERKRTLPTGISNAEPDHGMSVSHAISARNPCLARVIYVV